MEHLPSFQEAARYAELVKRFAKPLGNACNEGLKSLGTIAKKLYQKASKELLRNSKNKMSLTYAIKRSFLSERSERRSFLTAENYDWCRSFYLL